MLNKRFFQDLANWHFWALGSCRFPEHAPKDAQGRDSLSLIRLITRMIFCWFLKEKGLLPDALFDARKAMALLSDADPKQSTYYKAILQNLFFATLNQEMTKREFRKDGQHFMAHNLYRYQSLLNNPDEALALFSDIPFMNGGLFECLDKILGTKEKPSYIRIDGFSDRSDNAIEMPNELFFGDERGVDLSGAYGDKKFKSAKVHGLIHILDRYKFTVTENTPIEEEVALDPELLGKVFENLLAAYNPETEATARKLTGSFYTPREIVGYMVDESLIAILKTKLEAAPSSPLPLQRGGLGWGPAGSNEERLRQLFAYNDQPHQFTSAEVDALIEAIDHLKILDPACGSGAFPMGVLHKLVFVLDKLDRGNERWREVQRKRAIRETEETFKIGDNDERSKRLQDINDVFEQNASDYGRKLYLIENCIYGVDIQPIAVQISKLRFFISLIVDQRTNLRADNLGIRPLPNLETKFVAANTLIGINRPGQQALRNLKIDEKEAELRHVRENHFSARTPATKRKWREEDARLRREIAELLKGDGWKTATAKMLAQWDPYDQNASAEFFDAEWMFGLMDGFDVVIANPPYVRQEKIKELKAAFEQMYECYTGVADLYVYFFERSLQVLKDGGILTFISSNKYFRAAYGEKLRGMLATRSTIEVLIDFGDAPVFTAIAYPSIILTRKLPPNDGAARVLTWKPGPPIEEFATIFSEQSFDLARNELTRDGWRLESTAVLRLLERLRKAGTPLGEYVQGRFYYGIKTGLNAAFVVDRETRDRLIAEHPSSKQVLKPFLRGRDVKRWVVEYADQYLIKIESSENAKHSWSGKNEKEAEKIFANTYPAIHRWLKPLREKLISRDDQGKYFWELRSCAYWKEFEGGKIVIPAIAQGVEYAPDFAEHYTNDKTSICVTDKANYLLGLLNSQALWWFIQQTAASKQGGFYEFKPMYVTQLPIPPATTKQRSAIEQLVERIMAAKQKNSVADVAAQEQEIDELVYKLYNLTPEEIRIIEDSAPTPAGSTEPTSESFSGPPPFPKGELEGVPRGGNEEPQSPPDELPPTPSLEKRGSQRGRSEPVEAPPPPITETEREDVLGIIRQLFSDGEARDRETALREVAGALGYKRLGPRIRKTLDADLLTAVRRGILGNERGQLSLLARSIEQYQRDFLKDQFLAAIGRAWIERDDAIRAFARWLGFRRTGSTIDEATRSLIKGLLREGRLQAEGSRVRRA